MKKRGNGEGTIYRRKDGRWAARYVVQAPEGPKRKDVYGKTRREVAEKLGEALEDSRRNGGREIKHTAVFVGDFLKRWLEDSVKGSVSQTTWERYEQIVRVHLAPSLGDTRLGDLSPGQIQSLYRAKLDAGLSPRTVQYVHVTLHKALKQAVGWGYLGRNVTEAVDVPKTSKKEINPLSPEQVGKLLKGCENVRDRAFYTMAVTTGMRRGELLALRWGDLTGSEDGTVRVRRALSLTRDGLVFVPPKTTKSKRRIDLTAIAVDALSSYRKSLNGVTEDALVFPGPDGGPMRPSTMSQHFGRLARKVGLARETRLHDLRHTTATLMFLNGTHPKVVQEVLGHSTISITLDLYTHFVPSLQRGAILAMDDLLAGTFSRDEDSR